MLELIQSDQNLYGEAFATLLFLSIFLLAIAGMRRGWRTRSQAAAANYGAVSTVHVPVRPPDGQALYTGTTVANSRLERVALPELFGRWRCEFWAEQDALLLRPYARKRAHATEALRLPDAKAVGVTGAHAGRAVGRERIAVVRWRLNDIEVDSGLQFADVESARAFVARWHVAIGEEGVEEHA